MVKPRPAPVSHNTPSKMKSLSGMWKNILLTYPNATRRKEIIVITLFDDGLPSTSFNIFFRKSFIILVYLINMLFFCGMKIKEIYKIRNGKWGIVVGDNDGNYITTICVKTKKYAIELSNNQELLKWCVDKNIKKGLAVSK